MAIAGAPRQPVWFGRPLPSRRMMRVYGTVITLGGGGVLGVAASLSPSSDGHGTHEQLGLPSCGWVSLFDLPCPTCGMTTAFAHAAEGELGASILAQPMGFVLAILTAAAVVVGAYTMLTGSRFAVRYAMLWRPTTMWYVIGLVLLAWAWKIAVFRGVF